MTIEIGPIELAFLLACASHFILVEVEMFRRAFKVPDEPWIIHALVSIPLGTAILTGVILGLMYIGSQAKPAPAPPPVQVERAFDGGQR